MNLTVQNADLSQAAVRQVRLRRALSDFAVLTADFQLGAALPDLSRLPGQAVTWEVAGKPRFRGFIHRASLAGDHLAITAWSEFGRRHLGRRTTSYGGGPGETSLKDLQGIAQLLEGVGGADQLMLPVHALFQFDETDWAMLARIAAWSRLLLLASATEPVAVFRKAEAATPRPIEENDVVERSVTIEASLTTGAADCRSYDPRTGELPAAVACHRAAELAVQLPDGPQACATETIYPSRDGITLNDKQRAKSLVQGRAALAFTWQAALRDYDAAPGDGLQLSRDLGGQRLLVVASELCYDAALPLGRQLRNVVDCCLADEPPLTGVPVAPGPVSDVWGQVCDVVDPDQQGRVKVAFAWHERPNADPASWQGVWCRVAQAFAGQTAEGKPYGSLMLPRPLDWGRVQLDPQSYSPPWFEGASYTGYSPAPAVAANPANEQLLFSLAGGALLLVRDGPTSQIELAIRKPDGSYACRIVLAGDGSIEILGNVTIQTGGKT